MLNINKIRQDFPMLNNKTMQGHTLVYFDSAATSLKPRCVIEAMNDYYFNYNSNVHRGDYDLAAKADQNYEQTRKTVAKFILRLYKQFAVIPRLIKIAGDSGKVQMYYWDQNDPHQRNQ